MMTLIQKVNMDISAHNISRSISEGKPLGVQSSFRGHRPDLEIAGPLYCRACIKFLFVSSEPHSHSRVHPAESTGDIRNPARGHQDDICRRRLGWGSGSVGLCNRTGLELHPGIKPIFSDLRSCSIGSFRMLGGFASSERFSGLVHFPEPSDESLAHSNSGLAFIPGGSEDAVVHGAVAGVRADESIGSFAEYPSEDGGPLFGDMPLGDFAGAFIGSFGKPGIGSYSVCGIEPVEPGHFGKDDSGRDVCDAGDGLKEDDIIPESVHAAKLKDFSSYNNSLSFKMFNGFKELRERKLSHGGEFVSPGEEPFLSRSSCDAVGAGKVMLHKYPLHPDLNFSQHLADGLPVAPESSEFAESFVRDKGFGDFVFGEKKGNKFGIDFIGFSAFFAGSVAESRASARTSLSTLGSRCSQSHSYMPTDSMAQ